MKAQESPAAMSGEATSGFTVADAGRPPGDSGVYRAIEFDLPESTGAILLVLFLLSAIFILTIRTSLRDSRFLSLPIRILILLPRVVVLLFLLLILSNPRERTQISRIERSRVGILVDTSLSMTYAARDSGTAGSEAAATEVEKTSATTTSEAGSSASAIATAGSTDSLDASRSTAVTQNLIDSGLLKELSETHELALYTFDSSLKGPEALMHEGRVRFVDSPLQTGLPGKTEQTGQNDNSSQQTPSSAQQPQTNVAEVAIPAQEPARTDDEDISSAAATERLKSLIQPAGAESRLGEAAHQLIGQMQGRTLSGLVILTDGQSNAGIDVSAVKERAERSGTRLICVGVGNRTPQRNLWIAGMQSPEDVHKGDPFDLNILVQGSQSADQEAIVELFQETAGTQGADRRKVAEQSLRLKSDGIPGSLTFHLSQAVPGVYDYTAKLRFAAEPVQETTVADNERHREVEVTDSRIRVLLISSGPMRDYQFVRNILFRHPGIESDVWLQTITPETSKFVSQEAKTLLTRFPETEAELFQYDVIIAFDPDWSRLSPNEQQYLNRWVSEHSGGLVCVAGEIFTPQLAMREDDFRDIRVLYPVVLNRTAPELQISQRADQPWPLTLTREGLASDFLRITDSTGNSSLELWNSFRGIYRSYPVKSLRDGAVALLQYANPRAETEIGAPPFLASQYYGTGRTLFIGSPETWRLRELSPQGHQQLWTSIVREAGQGRRSRGTARGRLLLDRAEAMPGQAVNIRAQLYDAQLQALKSPSVPFSITDPDGNVLPIPSELFPDGRGTGQYLNNFRPVRAGRYRISVPVPDSTDTLQGSVEVIVPNLESLHAEQNVDTLTTLAKSTNGDYLTIDQLRKELSALLPNRSEPVIIDEQLRTLWDRSFWMYLMILLLSLEWAVRRIVRLS